MIYPILKVGMHNYPSGDDYWFGIYTYQGFKQAGIVGALAGSCKMIAEIFETWQGTWFTIFLFTLSPQNFNPHGYVIVVFISTIGLALAEYIILKRYLCKEYAFSTISFISLFFIIFNLSLQYIPRTTSGVFWFNGIMHYTIPYVIAMGCISSSRLFLTDDNKKHICKKIFFVFGMVALGGSNYLAAIIGLLGVCYEIMLHFFTDLEQRKGFKIKQYVIFIVAIVLEFVGLFISYKSPGNNIRANDDMSFRPKYFLKCIWWSIDRSRIKVVEMFSERPILWMYLAIVGIIVFIELYYRRKENENYQKLVRYSLLALLFVNGTHAISYLPEVYAASDVSGGVPNTHYWMVFLVLLADVIIVEDLIYSLVAKRSNIKEKFTGKSIGVNKRRVILAFSLISFVVIFAYILSGPQITTRDYCEDYIASGRMADYEQVWWEQYRIYTDSSIENAVIPEYYMDIYPALHMVLSGDSNVEHNIHRARYYNKKSVVAFDCSKGD